MQGLIIRAPWIDMILAGTKTWEMRTSPCPWTGCIGLIRKGTGLVVGVADVVASLSPLDAAGLAATRDRHGVAAEHEARVLESRWLHPWVLENVRPLPQPVPAGQKPGQVIWVTLSSHVTAAIDEQLVERGRNMVSAPPASAVLHVREVGVSAGVRVRPSSAVPMTDQRNVDDVMIELTAGAIRNGNICLRSALRWLPDGALGGSNKSMIAISPLTIVFAPGETVETDIASDKMLLRCRGAVLDFFKRSGAMPGNRVRVRRQAHNTLGIELER